MKRSVLIVDDESEILQTLKRAFDLAGVSTVVSSDPVEGVELHRKSLFPVLLTDVRMPTMSGMEFIRQVKQIQPASIVFVMTGYATLTNLAECLELGAADYFMKPFRSVDVVTKAVAEAMERHERWTRDLILTKAVRA